jgi:hypothetical protein
MSKTIYFAGVSRVNGELKFRGAQNVNRITQLQKLGDTEVEMRYLNAEMTKSQAAKRLIETNFANGRADILALLVSVANDDNPFAVPKNASTVRVKARKIKVSKAAAEADDIKLTPRQAAKIREEFNARLKDAYEAN